MHAGISKWNALKALCESLNIDLKDTIAIGDNQNDKEMLENSAVGIAMGNAAQDIKDISNYVTKNFDEDGVAYAINNYIIPLIK